MSGFMAPNCFYNRVKWGLVDDSRLETPESLPTPNRDQNRVSHDGSRSLSRQPRPRSVAKEESQGKMKYLEPTRPDQVAESELEV